MTPGQGLYYTWRGEKGLLWLRVGGVRTATGDREVTLPIPPTTLLVMLRACGETPESAAAAVPLIPPGHPQRGFAEGLLKWLRECKPARAVLTDAIHADSMERWAEVVQSWLEPTTAAPPAGEVVQPAAAVPVAPAQVQPVGHRPDPLTHDVLPLTLDGWPMPDSDESAALWQLRRVHMLLRECIRLGCDRAIAEYRTDLRDWADRLAEAIRHFREVERRK
jgi:hypothetical protein